MDGGNLASGGRDPSVQRARGSSDDASRPGPSEGGWEPLGRGRGLPRPGLVRPLPGEVGDGRSPRPKALLSAFEPSHGGDEGAPPPNRNSRSIYWFEAETSTEDPFSSRRDGPRLVTRYGAQEPPAASPMDYTAYIGGLQSIPMLIPPPSNGSTTNGPPPSVR